MLRPSTGLVGQRTAGPNYAAVAGSRAKHGPGLSDVTIADPLTNANQIIIRGTSNISMSWELSRAGLFRCMAPLKDLRKISAWLDPSTLVNRWLHYKHPYAGNWGGVVTAVDVDDGLVTITAESWGTLLKGAVTSGVGVGMQLGAGLYAEIDKNAPHTGIGVSPASLAINILPDPEFFSAGQSIYDEVLPAVIERWETETLQVSSTTRSIATRPIAKNGLEGANGGGKPTPVKVPPADTGDTVQIILEGTELSPFGWTIGDDRRFHLGVPLQALEGGGVRSSRPHLHDGIHTISSGYTDDAEDIINWVRVEADVSTVPGQAYGGELGKLFPGGVFQNTIATATVVGINARSISRYGVHPHDMMDDTLYPSLAALQEVANKRAAAWSRNRQRVTIECANVNNIWTNLREGTLARVSMSNNKAEGWMLIRQRALDIGRGVMTVSGEAELTKGL